MGEAQADVDVSVVVMTYFHEAYIAQALESILSQETTLRYEILVGDDASEDRTPEIIREYAARYPDVIRPVLRTRNLGANGNALDLTRRCRGRYIATLEGDDYWLDPRKLQKQWEFLESHPEYSACCGKCLVVDQNGTPDYTYSPRFFRNKKVLTLEEFLDTWNIPGQAGTIMSRNDAMTEDQRAVFCGANRNVGDKTSVLFLLLRGPIYCMNDVLSCYRYVPKGGQNYFSKHYADPYRNYNMFLYPCRLESWLRKTHGIRHYTGKRKEYRFCRFVEELVREPSAKRLGCLMDMIVRSHQPVRYVGLVFKALIEMED